VPTILQIIPRLDTGGAELSAIEITEALVAAGARALVATEGGRMADRVTAAGGELVPFPVGTKNPLRILANAGKLARIVEREGVSLLHARSRAPAWSALLAARRTGRPFVTTYHGAYGEKGPAKRLYNSVMARGDRVIANSHYTGALIRQRYGTPEARIRVIHRGVDMAALDPAAVSPERVRELRRAWGVEEDEAVVLQAARLTGWKGQRVLIEAAGRLKAAGRLQGVRIVLAGDDQGRSAYAESLASLARARGLAEDVILPGHVADIAAAFASARVAVVASVEPEAFGRAATEAQAMGCPVIATAIGAPPETVVDMRSSDGAGTGWLVPPGEADALAEALADALDLSPEARAAIGARARAHIGTRFTLAAMRQATLGVYDELLGTDLAQPAGGRGPFTIGARPVAAP
jgi:glycosyltransferase involved in cell wall biosynthesis